MECNTNSFLTQKRNNTYDAIEFFNDLTKEYTCYKFKEDNYLLFCYNSPTVSTMTMPVELYTWNNNICTIGSSDIVLRLRVENSIVKGDDCLEVSRCDSSYCKYTIFFQDGDLSIFIKNRRSC